ncbi:MAG: MFS transporter, partial [Candidatus Spyradocola sp.]
MKIPKFVSSFPTRADLLEMRAFLLLWSTQSLSSLGSSMTAFALVVWSYEAKGSALTTALLSVCSYAPYVLVSVFAGALSDRWNKKAVLLLCDGFAALTTLLTLFLLCAGRLEVWHLYALNALNGLMNSVQQPASEVATTLLTPRPQFQRAASLRALSSSVVNLLTPALAAAVLGAAGLPGVIAFDLATFAVAALALAFGIRLPKGAANAPREENLRSAARDGLR